ncbi:hypothetical protein SISNIDRAFT_491547 [Sistotremastrum niveocremeum HHB9708]|uniref:DUF6533 domain-containing protein n=1 Tax=Sistotremastrum niveocremeum HHB9708 TaxID=1314777 RepID=A0A164MMZ1_9AGAM|nr:hypothetical protein SISNIDRAFT_491547 [Sistotremastrum niveocremeum HHB9708]
MSTPVDLLRLVDLPVYGSVSAITWLGYNILLTLDDEIEYIWKSSWTIYKGLYFYCRYCGFFLLLLGAPPNGWFIISPPSDEYCRAFHHYIATVQALIWLGVDSVLLIRVYALFACQRRCLIFLLGLLSLTYGIGIWVVLTTIIGNLKFARIQVSPMSDVHICADLGPSQTNLGRLGAWAPTVIYNTVLLGMTIYKLRPRRMDSAWSSRYTKIILLDGAWVYLMMICLGTVQYTALCMNKLTITSAAYPWIGAISAYSGSRFILDIRKLHRQPITVIGLSQLDAGVYAIEPSKVGESASDIRSDV